MVGKYQPLITHVENGQRRIDGAEMLDPAEFIRFDQHEVLEELRRLKKYAAPRLMC